MTSLQEKFKKVFSVHGGEIPERVQNSPYYSLTPDGYIENGEEYFRALDWALNQKDIKNIAISGPYGSGKSSVIDSYLNSHKDIKPLRISMATFDLAAEKNNNKDNNLEDELQTGILKQLFYSTSADKLPDSRYRKLTPEKKWKTVLYAILLEAVIVFFLCLFAQKNLSGMSSMLQAFPKLVRVFIAVAVIIIGGFGCCTIIRWGGKNGSVKKVSVGSAAVEASEETKDSVFNKNMDEIIYFFERRKPGLVIFEDLDRFNNIQIFSALRELNTILNNYEKITNKVVFIYAVRDDVFEQPEERTKFFDFIIPIVPYISSTNSEDILRKLLYVKDDTDKSTKYDIDGAYVSLVSPYITDMRTLENICNEFSVFAEILKRGQGIGLEETKILSLVIFKNLYPSEFSDIENETESNLMREALQNKQELVARENELIEDEKSAEEQKLSEIEKETLNNISELKVCLLSKLAQSVADADMVFEIDTGKGNFTFQQMMKDNFKFENLDDKNAEVYYLKGSNTSYIRIDIKKALEENCEKYISRIEMQCKGLNKCKQDTKSKIEEYERKINTLRAWTIKEIIKEFGTDFLGKNIQENDLLVFLLRQGFIDETYMNCINYFHPNSLTKGEMNFILGIRNHRWTEPYSYSLHHVGQVFVKLQDYELKQPEALNFDLVDYILVNESESSAANQLFSQLADHTNSSMDFVKAYFDRSENSPVFIKKLCKDVGFWNAIDGNEGISEESEYKYLVAIFQNAAIEHILAFGQPATNHDGENENNPLIAFILSHVDILQRLKDVPAGRVIEILQKLNIVFVNVDIDGVDESILQDIFQNNRYELSPVMIGKLFEWQAADRQELLMHQSYTQIRCLQYQPLLDYVYDNFESYIEDNVLAVEENTEEDIEAVNDALERLIDQKDRCLSILVKEKVIWKDINDCCAQVSEEDSERKKEIWNYLLNNDRIFCNWNNVACYYETYGNDEAWVNYFERNADSLLEDIENPVVSDAIISELTLSKIAIDHYQSIVSSNRFYPYDGSLNGLNPEKIRVLIEEGKLSFSKRYWNEMRQFAPELITLFASSQPEKFMTSFSEISPTEKEIEELIQEDSFSVEDRQKMLLGLKYSSLSEKSAEIISRLRFPIPREYFDGAWKLLENGPRKQMLLGQMESLTNDDLPKYFQQMGDEYQGFMDRTRRHKFRLEASEYNKALTNKLFEKGYISSREEKRELLKNKKGTCLVIEGYIKAAG